MADTNLLVSHDPGHTATAKASVENALKEVKESPKFLKSNAEGLFFLRVKNPRTAIKSLSKLLGKKPELFSYTHHWMPVDVWCSSGIPAMKEAVKKLQAGIKKEEKWKMELNKRNYDKGNTVELILRLTEGVDRPNVDLEKPKKILKVEISGSKAGISLITPEEMLAIPASE